MVRFRTRTRASQTVKVGPFNFKVAKPLGRGGMADIYLAQADTGFGDATRLVVIKEVLPQLAHSVEFEEMLVTGKILDNCTAAAWAVYKLWRERQT